MSRGLQGGSLRPQHPPRQPSRSRVIRGALAAQNGMRGFGMRSAPRHILSSGRQCSLPILVCLAVICACAAAAQANLGTPHVVPPEPTESDSVSVEVGAGFGDGCWYIDGHSCAHAVAGSLEIHVYAIDLWQPGWLCTLEAWGVLLACEFGQLGRGNYTATVFEHRESLRYPDGDTRVLEFEVLPSTSIEHWTWARIRALYRP